MSASAALPTNAARQVATRVTELIRAEVNLDTETHFFELPSSETSTGGLFIATHRDVELGQPLLVELRIEGRVAAARATVCWRTPGGRNVPSGIGVTLHDLSDRDQWLIESFCSRRPPFYFDIEDRTESGSSG